MHKSEPSPLLTLSLASVPVCSSPALPIQCPEQVSLLYAKAHYESLRSIAQPDLSEQRTARALKLAQDARAAGDPDSAVEEAVYQVRRVGTCAPSLRRL